MRRFLKLTREDAAACLGITREQYKDIEMGREELTAEDLELLDELRFDSSYILTGIYSSDHFVKKALEVMTDKDYERNIEKLHEVGRSIRTDGLTAEELSDEWKKITGVLAEIASYGAENYNEKVLRDIPDVRFLTDRIEEGPG